MDSNQNTVEDIEAWASPAMAAAGTAAPGSVRLNPLVLKQLRQTRLLSQEELADQCWRRQIRVSIASIKRAETAKPVLYRIARELARFHGVPVQTLLAESVPAAQLTPTPGSALTPHQAQWVALPGAESNLVTGVFPSKPGAFLLTTSGPLLAIENARLQDKLERQREQIHALEAANRALQALSLTDGLTGIANRRHFDQVWAREWQRAQREHKALAVCVIDVDHFKAYNDYYGHQAGDDCLRRLAQLLAAGLRRGTDFVARFGGEEFVVILSDHERGCALARIESLRDDLVALALPHPLNSVGPVVTISAGLAVAVPSPALSADKLLSAADCQLYRAKTAGRNRISVAP